MSDPLLSLVNSLQGGRGVPCDWVVEYAPDGKLGALWRACRNANTLLELYAHTGDRQGYVLASAACAREALPYINDEDRSAWAAALAAAERWAHEGVYEPVPSAPEFEDVAVYAVDRTCEAVTIHRLDAMMETAAGPASEAVAMLRNDPGSVTYDRKRFDRAQNRELNRLAKIVRQTLRAHGRKPPTVARLTEKQ